MGLIQATLNLAPLRTAVAKMPQLSDPGMKLWWQNQAKPALDRVVLPVEGIARGDWEQQAYPVHIVSETRNLLAHGLIFEDPKYRWHLVASRPITDPAINFQSVDVEHFEEDLNTYRFNRVEVHQRAPLRYFYGLHDANDWMHPEVKGHFDEGLIDKCLKLLQGRSARSQTTQAVLRALAGGIGVFQAETIDGKNKVSQGKFLTAINRETQHLAEAARRLNLYWIAGPRDPLWLGVATSDVTEPAAGI